MHIITGLASNCVRIKTVTFLNSSEEEQINKEEQMTTSLCGKVNFDHVFLKLFKFIKCNFI